MTLGQSLPQTLRHTVADAWSFRASVEATATVQFERLAGALEAVSAPARLVEVAVRAASEERRHGELCAELALAYGAGALASAPPPPPLAPPTLSALDALAYAMVAHCCVAETESVATLSELIRRAGPPVVRRALVTIARDEVEHAQLGWAFVAWASGVVPLAFLGPRLPRMLTPGGAPLFRPASEEVEDARLLEHGVLPLSKKLEVFRATLEHVVLPGLARVGVDGAPARAWLAAPKI